MRGAIVSIDDDDDDDDTCVPYLGIDEWHGHPVIVEQLVAHVAKLVKRLYKTQQVRALQNNADRQPVKYVVEVQYCNFVQK